jgi:hypothetical protein
MRTSTTKPLEQFIACDGTKWTAEVYYPMGTKHRTYWMITLWSKNTSMVCTTTDTYAYQKVKLGASTHTQPNIL